MSDLKYPELKRCPFCGNEAELRTSVEHVMMMDFPVAWVECKACGISTGTSADNTRSGINILKVIEKWNRRIDEEVSE